MNVYMVNYNKPSRLIPCDIVNASVYVRANSAKEAKEIAFKKCNISKKDFRFCAKIETIN